jgi:hypothetical protein
MTVWNRWVGQGQGQGQGQQMCEGVITAPQALGITTCMHLASVRRRQDSCQDRLRCYGVQVSAALYSNCV